MGYHKKKILKGVYGEISKVREEVEEYIDAIDQGCKIMAVVELSDIYGALEAVAITHSLTMEELKVMSDITKKVFQEGARK
jgi:hypothetical protein